MVKVTRNCPAVDLGQLREFFKARNPEFGHAHAQPLGRFLGAVEGRVAFWHMAILGHAENDFSQNSDFAENVIKTLRKPEARTYFGDGLVSLITTRVCDPALVSHR